MLQMNATASMLECLLLTHEMVTILKRVQITPLIVDAMFVGATPSAARLYGYDRPEDFCGTWQSHTMSLPDYRKSFDLALCRHFAHDVPTRYITNILRPNGESVAVVKMTREWTFEGDIYWITHLTPANDPAVREENLPHFSELSTPEKVEAYRDFGGVLSVAEVEALLVARMDDSYLTDRQKMSILSTVSRQFMSDISVPQSAAASPLVILGRAITIWPNGQVLYECQSCGWIWVSKRSRHIPQRCANPNERCYNWRKDRTSDVGHESRRAPHR